jgi:hypothetical protein
MVVILSLLCFHVVETLVGYKLINIGRKIFFPNKIIEHCAFVNASERKLQVFNLILFEFGKLV